MIFRQIFRRKQLDRDLADEIREHLTERIDGLMAAGVTRTDATETARREFGNLTLLEERGRDVWRWAAIENLLRSIRIAWRRLAQSPGFTGVCVFTLALGLGANLAMFTLIRSVLLKPLPFPDPNRLVALHEADRRHDASTFNVVAAGSFADWQRESHSFSSMALWTWSTPNLSGQGGHLAEQVQGNICSWNLFRTLGVKPAYGRFFSRADDRPTAAATVVLTWGLFERRFGGNPSVVGKTILLDNRPYSVIGILPSWFAYPGRQNQLWTPAYHDRPAYLMQSHRMHEWNVVARLKPGVRFDAAVADVAAMQARIHKRFPDEPAGPTAGAVPLIDELVYDVKTPLYILMASVGCVLLITCLNVAGLLLARSFARRKEFAVRAALGGSMGQIVQEQLLESLLLAGGGGVVAASIAYALLRWIMAVRDLPRLEALHVDSPVLALGVILTLLTGLAAGLLSALSLRSTSILDGLRESSRSVRSGRPQASLRKYLVGVEVAFTVVLLIGAGLLLKSFFELRGVPPGFTTRNILTMGLSLPENEYKDSRRAAAFFDSLFQSVRALPSVEAAGAISTLPGVDYGGDVGFTITERPPLPKGEFQFAIQRGADTGAFQAFEIPLLRGREFTRQDESAKTHPVIISNAFAAKYFAHSDPIGQHVRLPNNGNDYQIVGVVGDTRYQLSEPVRPTLYFPIYQGFNEAILAVRSRNNPLNLALPIQKLIAKLDPGLGVANILTMDEAISQSIQGTSFEATVVMGFAALCLLLASVGLYGVLSYVVAQKTGEIGIRIALGAQRGQLVGSTLLDGIKPAFFGLLFGVAGGCAAAQFMRSLLFGVTPIDFPC